MGETNKFYYDEKLKRWVEEGAEPPAEESAPPPPPTTASFQDGKSDYNLNNALNDQLHATVSSPEPSNSTPLGSTSAIPAIPPSSNQFSARGRMGVRSRYVRKHCGPRRPFLCCQCSMFLHKLKLDKLLTHGENFQVMQHGNICHWWICKLPEAGIVILGSGALISYPCPFS